MTRMYVAMWVTILVMFFFLVAVMTKLDDLKTGQEKLQSDMNDVVSQKFTGIVGEKVGGSYRFSVNEAE